MASAPGDPPQVSLHTLVRAVVDEDGPARARAQWWRRPEPQMLSRIGAEAVSAPAGCAR